MSEEKKPFTVSDRRHFTSEGEVRKPEADEPAAARGPAPAARDASPAATAAPGAEAPPSPPSSPAADARPAADASRPPEPGDERGPRLPSDFLGLLISLGAQ